MELCTPQTFSKLPNHRFSHSNRAHLQWRPSLRKSPKKTRFHSGLVYRTGSAIRSTSEESSSFTSQYVKDAEAYAAAQNGIPTEDYKKDKQTADYESLIYEPHKVEEKDDGAVLSKAPVEDSPLDFQAQLPEFFDMINIKYDPEGSSSIFLLGGGAVVALWLTSAIVGAIDSIPLFPKLLEVVGLGYTVWFSTRYLIFKQNRDELAAKIEELKQEVLGSNND